MVGSADEDDEFDFPQCDIPFDYPEFDDESVIHFASDLKGRKRTVFSQHRVVRSIRLDSIPLFECSLYLECLIILGSNSIMLKSSFVS